MRTNSFLMLLHFSNVELHMRKMIFSTCLSPFSLITAKRFGLTHNERMSFTLRLHFSSSTAARLLWFIFRESSDFYFFVYNK